MVVSEPRIHLYTYIHSYYMRIHRSQREYIYTAGVRDAYIDDDDDYDDGDLLRNRLDLPPTATVVARVTSLKCTLPPRRPSSWYNSCDRRQRVSLLLALSTYLYIALSLFLSQSFTILDHNFCILSQ